VSEYSDFEEDALWNAKPMKTVERVRYVFRRQRRIPTISRAAAF